MNNFSQNVFKKTNTNNETNKSVQNISNLKIRKQLSPEQSALKGLPTNAVTKNQIVHKLN